MNSYKPMLTDEEIERRREWQNRIYEELKKIDKKQIVKILGKEIIVLPGLFAPIFVDSITLAETVAELTREGDLVLDLGTGTGIQGIFASDKAAQVISVDINPTALECAKQNALHHNLDGRMKIFYSDLFSEINDKFDLIIFNPPFRWFKPRDLMERGEVDENYVTLNKFFAEAGNYLKPEGKILLLFSTSGDMDYCEYIIKKTNFKCRVIKEVKIPQNLRKVEIDDWMYKIFELKLN